MSDGYHGHGAVLTIGGTTFGNVIEVRGPDQTRGLIEISTMDSTGKYREYIPGMVDTGELAVDCNYTGTAAHHGKLQGLLTNTATQTITLTMNDHTSTDSKFSSAGFVVGLGRRVPFDDKITQEVRIKLSGSPTFTHKP
jgi:predicted secreted protein